MARRRPRIKHSPSPIAYEPWTVPILLVEKANYIEPDRSQEPPTVDNGIELEPKAYRLRVEINN